MVYSLTPKGGGEITINEVTNITLNENGLPETTTYANGTTSTKEYVKGTGLIEKVVLNRSDGSRAIATFDENGKLHVDVKKAI